MKASKCQRQSAIRLLVCLCICGQMAAGHVFLNQFSVHVEGGLEVADKVARDTGMTNQGQIGFLVDHYLFEAPRRARRSASISHDHHAALRAHEKVKWFDQQRSLVRRKREFHPNEVSKHMNLTDPLWRDQWYLHGGGAHGYDMNVIAAWGQGLTGKGVVVSVLDDGLERTHPDLARNYDPQASYDVNSRDNDPTPRYDFTNANRHGTRCAGVVAAEANNTKCVAGVAPNARIGGIRMLDGEVTDAVEATALSFNPHHIDVYVATWGPDDDGRVVEGPGPLARKAMEEGIKKGRDGKGSILVWASGNGGRDQDWCGCDGYVSSVYTLSVGSTSAQGLKPWYLEECSAMLAATYSSDDWSDKAIASTDLKGGCTREHTGTSASAPLAAGIVALTLEANPNVTWRDVQYMTVMTSRPEPLQDGHWVTNGMGRKVSSRYGYGLMDAGAMVKLARDWTNLPDKAECVVTSNSQPHLLYKNRKVETLIVTTSCEGLNTEVNYLEHVQAIISLNYRRRGDVAIYLTSPSGTRSQLLSRRPRDATSAGFDQWPFLSVQFWGENPRGTWTLEVDVGSDPHLPSGHGILETWSLVFHGTKARPAGLPKPDVDDDNTLTARKVVRLFNSITQWICFYTTLC